MTERPNKKALIDGLDIYRDAMRPFMVRCLKRVPGKRVEDHIKAALQDGQHNQFEQNIRDGRSVEESLDIGDFPQLVRRYWPDVFREAFRSGSHPSAAMNAIVDARNRVSHPDNQDIDAKYAVERLNDIGRMLAEVNEPEQSQAVENIRHALMPFKPKSTDGRREDSGRGVRELRARWPGLHWGRWEGGGRSSVAAQGPYGRLRGLRCAGW